MSKEFRQCFDKIAVSQEDQNLSALQMIVKYMTSDEKSKLIDAAFEIINQRSDAPYNKIVDNALNEYGFEAIPMKECAQQGQPLKKRSSSSSSPMSFDAFMGSLFEQRPSHLMQ